MKVRSLQEANEGVADDVLVLERGDQSGVVIERSRFVGRNNAGFDGDIAGLRDHFINVANRSGGWKFGEVFVDRDGHFIARGTRAPDRLWQIKTGKNRTDENGSAILS